jgi:hypothetical protein
MVPGTAGSAISFLMKGHLGADFTINYISNTSNFNIILERYNEFTGTPYLLCSKIKRSKVQSRKIFPTMPHSAELRIESNYSANLNLYENPF